MKRTNLPRSGKFAVLRSLVIFNFAALVGFVLGTVSFGSVMFLFGNATFAWLFANGVGGLSHFGSNFVLQGQRKCDVCRNFVVFNATGIVGFVVATVVFAVSVVGLQDSTAAWFLGSLAGTLSHFVLNDKAMKFSFRR